ncbi:MAG: hypothetical protein CME62_09895 [Halobacteriovoraceae bacterium]|nr:hypothetical protein [Halobacteriovoraceae bacterium]|tara:strand:+ start:18563 stop:18940 length:378 start_codon:yes stop_codon:yes gene_type:complete
MMTQNDIKINITENALAQISLIKEHDYTVADMEFRLKIDGKGCGGFDYALGFTPKEKDDIVLEKKLNEKIIHIHIDPFTAFYCQEGELDYIQDFEVDREGFQFINSNEKSYRGKFFKNETKLPQF